MTTEQIIAELEEQQPHYCSTGAFALINRMLNKHGRMARVTTMDPDEIWFTIVKRETRDQ